MSRNREEITGQAIDSALEALKDLAAGKPASQSVADAHAALDRADAVGITADEYCRYER